MQEVLAANFVAGPECGSRSVLATRKPPARPQRRRKCAALHAIGFLLS